MNNFDFIARKSFTMDKFATQAKISTSAAIEKVLSVQVSSAVTSSQINGSLISISGKSTVSVIYLNAEGVVEQAQEVVDFAEKQQVNFALEDIYSVDNCTAGKYSVSGGEVVCVLEHLVEVSGNYKYEISNFDDASEDLVQNKKSLTYQKFVASNEDSFVIAEEFDSGLSEVNVLSSSAQVMVSGISASADKVIVDGKIICNIICSEQEGISSVNKEVEFKQEIGVGGTLPTMLAKAHVGVLSVMVTPEQKDNKTTFVCSFDMFAKVSVYEENTLELTQDLFSLKNELQVTYDYVDASEFAGSKTFSDTTLSLSDVSALEGFDDIVGVFAPKIQVEGVEKTENGFAVLSKISALALYKTDVSFGSIVVNQDVRLEISDDEYDSLGEILAAVSINSYKVKAGKDLEIIFKTDYLVGFNKQISERVVKSIEVKAEKPVDASGIKVYVTSAGENLFDVSKILNVKPEIISSQNEVSGEFECGEKIYVYSPINLL